jgi:hypothetical protein
MPAEIVAAVTLLMCAMIASIVMQRTRTRQTLIQTALLKRGEVTTGKVVAINRPIGLPYETHVYFTYEVPGVGQILQSCRVDMRALRVHHDVAIPTIGTEVFVRYLPEAPRHAVIAQLIPCLAGFNGRHGHVPAT